MPKFAVYYVPPAEDDFYRLGTSVLGYDVRARKPAHMPEKLQGLLGNSDWVKRASPYGFHLTIGDAIDFVPGDMQSIERELDELLHCFAPDHRFTIQRRGDDFVTFWGQVVVLRYDPNDYLRMLHTLVVARLHTLGSGSGYLERYLENPAQYAERPHQAHKVRKFYSPTALDDYAPHFTLLNPYTGDEHDELARIFLEMFGRFAQITLVSICLLMQMNKDEPWEIYREFKL
jgi:hypothetical protein